MRIAALAFGLVAGLVASLILALGGLDPAGVFGLERQVSLVRFGLFVVGNLGVFGAALVLAAPLAGAIVLAVAAVSWSVAAALLHVGPGFVMLTPPAILLVAIVLAVIAHVRRPLAPVYADDEEPDEHDEHEPELPPPTHRFAFDRPAEPAFEPEAEAEPELEQDQAFDEFDELDDLPTTPVRAGFFGLSGTANPAKAEPMNAPAAAASRLRNLLPQPRRDAEDDWSPGRRRPPPPSQQAAFREFEEDDEDDEPSGLARFALGLSNLLNFGLYAALTIAALLIFLNLRTLNDTPAAAPVQQSAAPVVPSSEPPPPPAPAAVASIPAPQPEMTPPVAPVLAEPEPADAPSDPFQSSEPLSSSEPPPLADEPPPPAPVASAATPMPYEIPPAMAAARAQPAPLRAVPAAPKPVIDTGL